MDHVDGKPLYDIWFDKTTPADIVQARRTRVLGDIAAAMVQLDKYSFDQGGVWPLTSKMPRSVSDPFAYWTHLLR